MAEYDLIIRGGTIVDGLRTPRYVSDLGIKNGRIAQIGGLRRSDATRVLDASGLIVAPGFVDLHTHYDAQIHWDPYCVSSGWQGITTVVMGNCGFGFAPCARREKDQDRLILALSRNEAIPFEPVKLGMRWDWETFPEYLDALDRMPKGVNVITHVPLSPLYAYVMGYDEAKQRRPNDRELQEMCRLLQEGMDAGAAGWSAQVAGPKSAQADYDGTPMITDLMTERELLAFARALGERDEGTIQLTYSFTGEEPGVKDEPNSRRVFESVASASGRPILYQQVNPMPTGPEAHRSQLQWLEQCAMQGLRMYGQADTRRGGHNIRFDYWNLWDSHDSWKQVTLGTLAERKAKMDDLDFRQILKAQWEAGSPGISPGSIATWVVKETGRKDLERYVGETIGEIAQREKKHVVDALFDITVADDLHTVFFGSRGRDNYPEYHAEVMRSPYVVGGLSDGGAHMRTQPTGCYGVDLLAWVVRDSGVLSLEEAHYKLSCLPALVQGIGDRGFLGVGTRADMVVYDLSNLSAGPEEVAHDLPGGDWRRVQKPKGLRWILVNGQPTFEDGKPTGALPGRLLRHGIG